MNSTDSEPRIVGFLCNWCTYAAADTAGISRMEQPSNVDIIRVMCSGRIDPVFILKAFAEGADVLIVSGCHPPGDCHYQEGNYKTFRRMPLVEALLAQYGIEKERFHWGWISGAEAPQWAQLVREFTVQVHDLGPDAPPAEHNILGLIHKVGLEIDGNVISSRGKAMDIVDMLGGKTIR